MVKSEDLRGRLGGVPLAIARLMSIRQFQQTGEIRPEVFSRSLTASSSEGGITWIDTPEGEILWDNLLWNGSYRLLPLHYTSDIAIFPNLQLISDCYGKTE